MRRNIFAKPTAAELRNGSVTRVNVADPLQTGLPQFDTATLHVITGGPYQVRLADGYLTSIQVISTPSRSHISN